MHREAKTGGGSEKNGYGRTNNSDAVQGEKNSSPEPYPEAAYGLRPAKKKQGRRCKLPLTSLPSLAW